MSELFEPILPGGTESEGVTINDATGVITSTDSFTVESKEMIIYDSLICLNQDDIGPGITKTPAWGGFEVNRGTGEDKYQFYFDESDDKLKAGFESDKGFIPSVDTGTFSGILRWEAATNRFVNTAVVDPDPVENLEFVGADGNNKIIFPDNLNDALSFLEGTNKYMTFKTTDGDESINMVKNTNISGDLSINGLVRNTSPILVANTNLATTYYVVIADATSGNIVLTLPAQSSNSGRTYKIIKIDNSINTVGIKPTVSEKLNGQVDYTLTLRDQSDRAEFDCTGANGWFSF